MLLLPLIVIIFALKDNVCCKADKFADVPLVICNVVFAAFHVKFCASPSATQA